MARVATQSAGSGAGLSWRVEGDRFHLAPYGDWLVGDAARLSQDLARVRPRIDKQNAEIEVSEVGRLDTAGAYLLYSLVADCDKPGDLGAFTGMSEAHRAVLAQVAANACPACTMPEADSGFAAMLGRVGAAVIDAYRQLLTLLDFLGNVVCTGIRVAVRPIRVRVTSTMYHMEAVGLDAVPIVSLMAFMVGAVVAFLGAKVLRQFGAEVFTVELIGFGFLREFGVLLTAILVAGRTGSAFTAQIGAMQAHEEVDAIRALGLDVVELLVLPRMLALIVMLPILTFIADLAGLFGGGMVAWAVLDISPTLYLSRLADVVAVHHFWAGMVKAPVFAILISAVGCLEGMKVRGSAESVGRHTTSAVVQGIFLVILADALFAMLFLEIDF